MNKKYISWIVVVIVILGLVAIFSNQGGPQSSQTSAPKTGSQMQTPTMNTQQPSTAAITATGNVDDIAATVLGDSDSDEPPATESDQVLLSENDSAISDYGQSLSGATQ